MTANGLISSVQMQPSFFEKPVRSCRRYYFKVPTGGGVARRIEEHASGGERLGEGQMLLVQAHSPGVEERRRGIILSRLGIPRVWVWAFTRSGTILSHTPLPRR